MRGSGVCLSIFVLLASLCFSSASQAQGLLEVLFGGAQHQTESQGHYADREQHRILHSAHARRADSRHQRWMRAASRSRLSRHALLAMRRDNPVPTSGQMSYAATPGSAAKALAGDQCCSSAREAIAKVIRDDPTLRSGDAYMTSDGLRVFDAERRDDQKFVPVDQAHKIGRDLKARLAELEKKRPPDTAGAPKSRISSASGLHEPTGAAEQKPMKLEKERLIKTSAGKTIRLVGGFAN
jgi:hypothetical protein